MDGSEVAGHTYYFSLFSLFPETFKGTENGLRRDIAEAFNGMFKRTKRNTACILTIDKVCTLLSSASREAITLVCITTWRLFRSD